MKRRKFIRNVGIGASFPIAFQGMPLKTLGAENIFNRMAAASTNDNVLVILQMIGGNDALNTFIPINDYDEYARLRPDIAIPKEGNRAYIPLDSTLATEAQVGLHPDMIDFKDMYDSGKASVFQSVGYENMSGSHFRGTDIIFQGSGGGIEVSDSGWLGRFIKSDYAPLTIPDDFPSEDNPDPLALETGSGTSGLFLHPGAVPTSLSLGNRPEDVGRIIRQLDGFGEADDVVTRGKAPDFLEGTFYNDELNAVLSLENQTEVYIERIANIFENTPTSSVEYPEDNKLSDQLSLIARLLAGGIKTKIFRVSLGGFDTHGNQVTEGDKTVGIHASLLNEVTTAMKAFQDDLASRGLEDRVLTATISEFGRRIAGNGSRGTAHGRGGAVMMFGKKLNPGVYGNTPDLTQNNIDYQLDYRQVFANLLHEWMGVSQDVLANEVFFKDFIAGPSPLGGNFEPLNVIADSPLSVQDHIKRNYRIEKVYPNPADKFTQVELFVNNNQDIRIEVASLDGKVVARSRRQVAPGNHTFMFTTDNFRPGFYIIRAKSERLNETKKLWVRH